MGLNIKNQRVHDLAREAARRTGRSQTSVIEVALEKLLAELPAEPDRRRARVDAFLGELDVVVTDDLRAAVRAAERGLYDESGMPA